MNERIAAVRQNELQQEYQVLREKIIEELKEETDRKIKNQVREHFKNIQDEVELEKEQIRLALEEKVEIERVKMQEKHK